MKTSEPDDFFKPPTERELKTARTLREIAQSMPPPAPRGPKLSSMLTRLLGEADLKRLRDLEATAELERRARFRLLHSAFDELLANYLLQNRPSRPSTTTAMDLLLWSAEQCGARAALGAPTERPDAGSREAAGDPLPVLHFFVNNSWVWSEPQILKRSFNVGETIAQNGIRFRITGERREKDAQRIDLEEE